MESSDSLNSEKEEKNPKVENPSSHFLQPELSINLYLRSNLLLCSKSPFPSRPPKLMMYKIRLHEFTQRSSIPLPVYETSNEGPSHSPKFRSNVIVDGTCYASKETFSHKKAAEQDVAKYTLECITKKIKDEGCPLIQKDTVFCKSILYEFAVKMNLEMPTYSTVQAEGLLPVFVSSVVFNGVTYTGEIGRSKNEAEQLAARAVILSLLGDPMYGTFLLEIIMAKGRLYVALNKVKDSSIFHLGTNSVPRSAILQPSAEAVRPHHELKSTKSEQGPERVVLPNSFVVPGNGQSSGVGESSSEKLRGQKKSA